MPSTPGSPQSPTLAAPDPEMQTLIDMSFQEVPVAFNSSETHIALCKEHKLEVCKQCGVDYLQLNRLAKLLHMNSNLLCPPPPQMISKSLSQAVNNTKEEGNVSVQKGFGIRLIMSRTISK